MKILEPFSTNDGAKTNKTKWSCQQKILTATLCQGVTVAIPMTGLFL